MTVTDLTLADTASSFFLDPNAWVDAGAVTLDDDTFAYVTATRELDYPYGYVNPASSDLLCEWNPAMLVGAVANDSIVGVEYVVRAKASRDDIDVTLEVEAGNYEVKSIALTSEWAEYTIGSSTDMWGVTTDFSGRYAVDDSAYSFGSTFAATLRARVTSGTGTATVYVEFIKLRAYWENTAPDVMTFSAQTNVPINEWVYSNVVTVAGMPTGYAMGWRFSNSYSSTAISEISHNNDGLWSQNRSGTARNGDTFQVRRMLKTRHSTDQQASSSYLNMHGVTSSFSTTSVAPDRTRNLTPAENKTHLPLAQWVHAFNVKISGTACGNLDAGNSDVATGLYAYTSNFTQWRMYLNNERAYDQGNYVDSPQGRRGPYSDSFAYSVFEGTEAEVWVMTPSTYGANEVSFFTVGDVTTTWYAYTLPADVVADQVFFTTPAPVTTNTVVESNGVTISGLSEAVTLTFSASGGTLHGVQKNGGTWYLIGDYSGIVNGDIIKLRMTSPAGASSSGNVTMKCGDMHANFCLVTTGGDVTPDTMPITALSAQLPGVIVESNVLTVSGATAAQPMIATVSPGFEIKVGAGAYTSGSVSCVNGNTLQLRGRTGMQPGEIKQCVLTVGGTQNQWTLTTRSTSNWD